MRRTKGILIVGGSGFVGTHLALHLKDKFKVFATYNKKPFFIPGITSLPMDVGNKDWIKRIVYSIHPDVVIFCAGTNDADWAEKNPKDADRIHGAGPLNVESTADVFQPQFIYLSNSYVFDGAYGNYKESDLVSAHLALGKAKLSGENFLRGKAAGSTILRCSPLLGRGNGRTLSFIDYLRINLDRGERVKVPHREFHSYVAIQGLCEVVEKLINVNLKGKVFHYGGLTRVTPFQVAQAFAKHYKYDPDLILVDKPAPKKDDKKSENKIKLEDIMFDYSLNSTQLVQTLKIKPLLLEESFDLLDKALIARF